MRLATFNVENLFERPAAMNLSKWSDGRQVLQDFSQLNDLIAQKTYTAVTKKKLLTIMERNTGLLTQGKSTFMRLREARGKLVYKPVGKPHEIRFDGRADWVGWFELIMDSVNEVAIHNTARIVNAVNADILCVVEADNRIALTRFNGTVIERVGGAQYKHIMLIDGNDDRGIDVGILTRKKFPIESMVSHVDDQDSKGTIFSRDCAEYRVNLPGGEQLLVMINHFKSKGYGSQSTSNAKRKRQAQRVRAIYEERRSEGWKLIAVAGDFNDTPDSDPLKPLLKNNSDLIDVMTHPKFIGDSFSGTYANGAQSGKIDFILLSPDLVKRVTAGGIERRGVWGGKNGTLFPHLREITKPVEAASDHAAIWVDFV